MACAKHEHRNSKKRPSKEAKRPGRGGTPYMGRIGMCGPKGYGFSAVLVMNRVSNLADSGHK